MKSSHRPTAVIIRQIILGSGLCLWFVAGIAVSAAPGKTDRDLARQLFIQAKSEVKQGQYAAARLKLQDMVTRYYQYKDLQEQSYLLLAIALYQQKDYPQAERQIDFFLRTFPQSVYADYANYLMSKTLFRRGDKVKSRSGLLQVLKKTSDTALQRRLERHMVAVSPSSAKPAMIPLSSTVSEKPIQENFLRIGLLCPLTRESSTYGEAMLRGAILAILEYNRTHPRKVQLVVEDSQEHLLEAIQGAKRLIADNRILGLVGPLKSNTTIAVGELAEFCRIPLVAPTASEYGITDLGKYIIQLNVPTEIQGELAAEFAWRELGSRNFAILAPFDDYGRAMAKGFERKVQELGGTIVSREWYYEGTTDYSPQFKKIRRRELIKTLNLMNITDETDVEKMANDKENKASRDAAKDNKKDDDNKLVTIRSIDAFFVPVYGEEIPLVASQIAFNKIETRIVGGDKWSDESILRQKEYIEGAVFPALVYKDRQSKQFQTFSQLYNEKYKEALDDITILGYDGLRLVLSAIEQGADTREKVLASLENIRDFEGVARKLSFPPGVRYNRHLDFFKIKDGKIVPYSK